MPDPTPEPQPPDAPAAVRGSESGLPAWTGGRAERAEGAVRAARADFAAAVLPVLLHRIRNTTQLVTVVNALLSGAEPEALCERRAEDLAQAAEESRELGWLLAVLSGGLGCELAHRRAEPGGLAAALALVRDTVRRGGGTLELRGPIPRLGSAAPAARLSLSVAELVYGGAERSAAAVVFERRPDGGSTLVLRTAAAAAPAHTESAPALDPRLAAAGAALTPGPDGFALELPATWLAREPAGTPDVRT